MKCQTTKTVPSAILVIRLYLEDSIFLLVIH